MIGATRRTHYWWRMQNAVALLCLGCERSAEVREACAARNGFRVVLIQALARALAETDVVGVEVALRALRLVLSPLVVETSGVMRPGPTLRVGSSSLAVARSLVFAARRHHHHHRGVREEAELVLVCLGRI